MSIILDALKKLNREKSFQRSPVTNIAVEILRPDLPHPRNRIPFYFVALFLTAVIAAAITYAGMLKFGLLSKSSVLIPMNPSAPSQQTAPSPPDSALISKPLPPVSMNPPIPGQQAAHAPLDADPLSKSSPPVPMTPPVPGQQAVPTPLSNEPVRNTQDEINQVSPEIQSPNESKKTSTIPAEKKVDQKAIVKEPMVTLEKTAASIEHTPTPAQQIPRESPTTPPTLKISAIVWYEEPSKRFAMVNGMIANEGSMIEGVKVEEIFPDHVRFSYNGRSFEIAIK